MNASKSSLCALLITAAFVGCDKSQTRTEAPTSTIASEPAPAAAQLSETPANPGAKPPSATPRTPTAAVSQTPPIAAPTTPPSTPPSAKVLDRPADSPAVTALPQDKPVVSKPTPAPVVPAVPAADASTEPRRKHYPSGAVREEVSVKLDDKGREINHGPYTSWYEDGEMKLMGGHFEGEQHGPWRSWFPNGARRGEGMMEHGKHVGKWTYWDDKDTKRREATYDENGLLQGPWSEWDDEGKLLETGQYVDGQKHGKWILYTATGQVESNWVNGLEQPS